ncbi:MAG: hypothetical protein K0S53_2712 [Bacteroidetes bacterium]|jgi:uncharacterized membrane protein|nr:hypothetical protein [Bacteroidota bacterium]
MKKIILSGIVMLAMFSCTQVNSNGEKTITKGGDTVADVDISLSKLDAINELAEIKDPSELLFRASGTEPGWFAEFYNDKLRLVVDYGKDSIWIEDSFEKIKEEKSFTYMKTLNEKSVTMSIESKSCTNAAGEKADRSVIIKFNNSVYKGCGSFVK